ncbi:MAG: amino acid ABC transporter ATP-binding protein [Deltaproteobacteria bacterium]|nr:amino acid ABC transporter ATP-binding protein [Deltaproteobacteria bacterium]
MLVIKNLNISFGERKVLKDLSFEVAKGEVVVVIGPSGCGKSTLLRCINGLETIESGSILLDGVNIAEGRIPWPLVRQKVGMVFQSYDLFPHKTVMENILMGPVKVQKRKPAEARAEAELLLERVGLLDRRDSHPRQLSGGQKQRVAIVRALCMNPEIMLFDEVTASLDPEMVREVFDVMLELARRGMTMLIVTHEMAFARAVADRVFFIDEGVIVESGPPEAFFAAPRSLRAQKFLNNFKFEDVKTKKTSL